MKTGQSFRCLFWALLYCVLYLVSASEDDLMDFDFTDLKEIDWNYEEATASNSNNHYNKRLTPNNNSEKKLNSNMVMSFDDYEEEDQNPFDWRERILRTALSKALTNRALRQKFVEVMPILRVLSSQQRLALSALISAQINAKKGQELKLEQVRMMFGDDKKLLIPIVYDIANMVRNSARNYLNVDAEPAALQQTHNDRRDFQLNAAEQAQEDDNVGVIDLTQTPDDSLEEFINPMEINEELQAGMAAPQPNRTEARHDRQRRAAEFVHKLIRSLPMSVNEDDLQNGAAGHTTQLNTTAFAVPNEHEYYVLPSQTPAGASILTATGGQPADYQQVEDLAFADLNGTAIDLTAEGAENREFNEPLPNPEELISGPRYRMGGNKMRASAAGLRPKYATKRKRIQTRPRLGGKVPPPAASSPSASVIVPSKKCERFTASMCIRTEDYPLDQIMGSIRRHKNAMSALLAEYHDNSAYSLDIGSDDFEEYPYNKKRREDEGGSSGGGMCQSIVRYARPQKARSAAGEWKYIVNTGQHTQTLRLEKCSNPQESCSYLAQSYRSHCSQVYNYHRLLSWDKSRGLHVDIFKVPTCCSCQVDGYRQQFPPLDIVKSKDFTPSSQRNGHNNNAADSYSTINEELDYNDEDDEDDLSYRYSNGFGQQHQHRQHHNAANYDENELLLGSKKVRTKAYPPPGATPTVGSYLSPPGSADDEYDSRYVYKAPRAGGGNSNSYQSRHRPYKGGNEARVDLEISPSETHLDKEVNLLASPLAGTSSNSDHKQRAHHKRKHIFSVPHTATSSTTTSTVVATTVAQLPPNRGDSVATFAHQTPAASSTTSPSYYTHNTGTNTIHPGTAGHIQFGHKPKTRFRSSYTNAHAFAPGGGIGSSATTSTTESSETSTAAQHKQSSVVTLSTSATYPYVNTLFSAKYNASLGGVGLGNPKRINYSYHPIIDFFDSPKRSAKPPMDSSASTSDELEGTGSNTSAATGSSSTSLEHALYARKRSKHFGSGGGGGGGHLARERRIGFGAGASSGVGGGVSAGIGSSVLTNDANAWHPMLVAA